MAKTKDIELLEPFDHHDKIVSRVTVREPSGGLYAELGEPRILVRSGQGGYFVEQPSVIKAYLDKCIVHPDGSELLKLMSLADVMQVKGELFGFFVTAEANFIAKSVASSSSASE